MRNLNINLIRSVDRAVDILNAFSAEKTTLTIDEVSKITKLPKATAYRLLYTLEKKGLIRYDPESLQYRLGFKLLDYGYQITSSLDMVKEAEAILTELHTKTGHTVLMTLIEGDEIVYVFKQEKQEGLKYSSSVGQRRSIYYGVLGRVFMAYLPEERIEHLLNESIPSWTSYTITDKRQIAEQLEEIRKHHIHVEINETTVGVTAFGAPVFDATGRITAAIGIICPSVQLKADEIQTMKHSLLTASKQISRKLGCNIIAVYGTSGHA